MSDSKVVIVHLRRPKQNDKKEMRSDPFYEFGSFGCTGCHKTNLMNPKKIEQLKGVQLAFAQGGPEGFKLIQLTPSVKSVKHGKCCELKWDKKTKFFKYQNAPLLISNEKPSDFTLFGKMLQKGKRTTMEGQFSSNFRSRRRPLDLINASEIIKIYSRRTNKTAKKEYFTRNYVETMHEHEQPPKPDNNRKGTYQDFILKAKTAKSCKCK